MQIFLSYATVDRSLVAQVKAAIGTRATVYCAEDDVRAGVNVHSKIQAALAKSDLVIALISDHGARSIYLHQETGFAKSSNKMIIPVVSANASQTSLGMLEGIEYIKLDENEDWLTRLSARVEPLVRENAQAAKLEADRGTTNLILAAVLLAAVLLAAKQV